MSLATQGIATTRSYQAVLSMRGGHPTVDVKIQGNDTPLHFVVDTAAGASVIDKPLAERLHLLNEQNKKVDVNGASGTSQGLQSVTLTNVAVGNLTISTLKALSIELNAHDSTNKPDEHVDGILGNDVLSLFDVSFDIPAKLLTLADPSAVGSRFASPSCHMNASSNTSNFGFLDVRLPHKDQPEQLVSARAVIDTGAAQTILNWNAARAIGLVADDAALKKRDRGTRGLDPKLQVDTYLYELPSLRLGPWQSQPLQVRISDLPVFHAIGVDRQPALILGIDILKQQTLRISSHAEKICFGDESQA